MRAVSLLIGLPAPPKPRLRGVSHQYAFFVSLACGVGLILAASDGRARVAASDLRGRRLGAARHERAVSPRDLAPGGAALDEAARPLDDLRADRRHLHARGAARAAGIAREHDPDRAVGRGARRRRLQARLDRRAEVAVRGGVRRCSASVTAAIFGELPAAIGWLGVAGLATGGAAVRRRRGRLRERPAEPVAEGVRLPRGLPRARDRGRRRCTTR